MIRYEVYMGNVSELGETNFFVYPVIFCRATLCWGGIILSSCVCPFVRPSVRHTPVLYQNT